MGVIYLVRHGQASFGPGEYDKLSDMGRKQAKLTGMELATRIGDLGLLATGPLERQRDTAELLAAQLTEPPEPREIAGLTEFDHTDIIQRYKPAYRNKAVMFADLARTLKPREAFQELFEKSLARWVQGDPAHEYAESFEAFRARSRAAFDELAEQAGGAALVTTSSGYISAVCVDLLGVRPEAWLDFNRVIMNASITKVIVGRRGRSLVTVNEHGHLERAGREFLTYR